MEVPDFDINVHAPIKEYALEDAKTELKEIIQQKFLDKFELPPASILSYPYEIFKYGYEWSSITIEIEIPFDV